MAESICSAIRAVEPAVRAPSHGGGSTEGSVGPNGDELAGRSVRASSLATAALTKTPPASSTMVIPIAVPLTSRRRRKAVSPSHRRAIPRPANRPVAARARSHG